MFELSRLRRDRGQEWPRHGIGWPVPADIHDRGRYTGRPCIAPKNCAMKKLLPLVLLLAACASTQPTGTGSDPSDPTVRRDGLEHNRATAEQFIVRQRDFRAGLIDYVDPRRATLTTRSLTAESVV